MSNHRNVIAFEGVFVRPLANITRTAKRRLKRYREQGGLLNAIAFDQAAEEQQLAAHRLDAATNLVRSWK
jgi:hypothetical protein